MKFLLVLVIPIWVFTTILSSIQIQANTDPPMASSIAEPVLPHEKQLPISQISSQFEAQSPAEAGVKVVHHQDLNKKLLIALIVSSTLLAGLLLLALSCFFIYRHKNSKNSAPKSQHNLEGARGLSSGGKKGSIGVFDYQLLATATNNFQENNILGDGGFGTVYKARFDDNFRAAVKRLRGGGQETQREFEAEVDWLSKIHHQNIVSLLGFCSQGQNKFLVYEMMDNGSLEFQLHGPSRGSALTWHLRMKIALDIARGLEYLHEQCNPSVIHRDLKSSNILLDSNFNAKLSDFGLAVAGGTQTKNNIRLSGTLGYVAPEYLLDGKLSDKSDVYAFGIVLLELLIGRKPVEKMSPSQCQSIVTWAMPQLTDRSKLPNIVDPAIRNKMDLKHLYQVAAVAVLCVQPEPSYRPLIMDVLHSFIPLVPVDLGGSLRAT